MAIKFKKPLKELRVFEKRLVGIEGRRLERLKNAKEQKSFKKTVDTWAEHQMRPKFLTDQQLMAIHLMTDFVHNYSYSWIARRIGVEDTTFSRWRNEPFFIEQLAKEIRRRRNFMLVHAYRNVHRALARGSMKDTWNFLKMTGDLVDKSEIIDRTGETEKSDEELQKEIEMLSKQLKVANVPSGN
jgi:hypothetical protein